MYQDKSKKNVRKTAKKLPKRDSKVSQTVQTLLEMLMTVKMYHWRTHSYAQHKATDELYERLNKHIDTFVEVYLGKSEDRLYEMDQRLHLYNFENVNDFKKKMHGYRRMLQDMNRIFTHSTDSDLLTVRDELLIDVNQFLYLMTFR
jgi:DNA-binding ferritin-like protein